MSGKRSNKRKTSNLPSSSPSPPNSETVPSSEIERKRPGRKAKTDGESNRVARQLAVGSSQHSQPPPAAPDRMDMDGDSDNDLDSFPNLPDSSSTSATQRSLQEFKEFKEFQRMAMLHRTSSSSSPLPSSSATESSSLGKKHNQPPQGHTPIASTSFTANPSLTGGNVNITFSSPPPLADDTVRALQYLASNPSLPDITSRMPATARQRADAAGPRYVPLAYFSPTGKVGSGLAYSHAPSTTHAPSDGTFIQQLLHAHDSVAREQKEGTALASAPRFSRWEEVITAFSVGLTPIACNGDPDRLADYMSLLLTVMAEHAKGKRHWPVFLAYIELLRRTELAYGSADNDANAVAKRNTHRLTKLTPDGAITLDKELLREIVEMWTEKSNLFSDFLVDQTALQRLFHTQTAVEASASARQQQQHSPWDAFERPPPYQRPPTIPNELAAYPPDTSSSSGPPTLTPSPPDTRPLSKKKDGPVITTEMATKIRAIPAPNNACINFLRGKCTSEPCPNERPHLTLAKVKLLLVQTQ